MRRVSPSPTAFSLYAGLVLLAVVLYWPTAASLWDRWMVVPRYSHGWLVFGISAWLIWREASQGRLAGAQPSKLGLISVPLLGAAWLIAIAGSVALVQWLLVPVMLFAIAFAMFGRTALRQLWFPFAFMFLVIPFWDPVGAYLQHITVLVVGEWLMAARIPALLDGYRVVLPVGSFEIVEGCSGMHYFMVAGTLSSLYGWLWYRRLGLTLGLVAVSLAVAMIGNWLRVFFVIYAGYVTEMQHFLVQVDHYYFGWAIFILLMAPVFWFARRFEPVESADEPVSSREAINPASGVLEGSSAATDISAPLATPGVKWLPWSALVFAGLAVAPLAWLVLLQLDSRPAPSALPHGQGGWTLVGPALPDWSPRYRGADASLDGGYGRGGHRVDVWIMYYERPRQGEEVGNQSNRLANRRDGRLRGSGSDFVLERSGGDRLIRYSHIVGGRESQSVLVTKIHQIVGTLSGQPEGALLAISVPCGGDCAEARMLLDDFERDMGGPLRATIAGRAAGLND
jgi:EpsI family protein